MEHHPPLAVPFVRDRFGRRIHYLRLSVTDRCNFRCVYCLPSGCPGGSPSQPLSVPEIERLVRAFAALGFWKVRLTGGEPTMRNDICEIVSTIAAIPGIRSVALTTNGYRLARLAPELCEAGLRSVNVSLDTLDPGRFEQVTGCDRLQTVVSGLLAAIAAGIPSVKINCVLLHGFTEREIDAFLSWTRRLPLAVRFIELMETGESGAFFRRHHLSAEHVRRELEGRGWRLIQRDPADGPAADYAHPDHAGRVGLVAPYSAHFCASCNRVRVSSRGVLRPCLFGEGEIPLRDLLGAEDRGDDLRRAIESAIFTKPASHRLHEGRCGAATTLAKIGG